MTFQCLKSRELVPNITTALSSVGYTAGWQRRAMTARIAAHALAGGIGLPCSSLQYMATRLAASAVNSPCNDASRIPPIIVSHRVLVALL